MRRFFLFLTFILAVYLSLGFMCGNYIGDLFIQQARADTYVLFTNYHLTNDPFASFTDAVIQCSVWTDDDLSVYVGDSAWGNEWDEFEIWYQTSIVAHQWAIFPIDGAQLGAAQVYYFADLVYDRMDHRDTLYCDLTSADFASSTSVNICECIIYCIDYAGM